MGRGSEDMRAVVCDDRPALRDPVVRLLTACGFEVPEVTALFTGLASLIRRHEARVVLIALPLTGMSGLKAVGALAATAPDCEIVLLSPSSTLELAALEAGARALVPEEDLRVLRGVLLEIAAAPRRLQLPVARGQAVDVPRGRASTKPSA